MIKSDPIPATARDALPPSGYENDFATAQDLNAEGASKHEESATNECGETDSSSESADEDPSASASSDTGERGGRPQDGSSGDAASVNGSGCGDEYAQLPETAAEPSAQTLGGAVAEVNFV